MPTHLIRLCGWLTLVASAFGAATTVQQTSMNPVRDARGGLANGSIALTPNQQFTTADGIPVYPTTLTVTVVNGVFSVALYPNDATSSPPSGTYYTARWAIRNSPQVLETWLVPTSGSPVGLSVVRSATTPPSTSVISPQQISRGLANTGDCMVLGVVFWAGASCGSSPIFSNIITGTNTTATMTCGSGCNLTFSATGIINASRIMGAALSGLTGIIKMTAGVPSVATAGTDYQVPAWTLTGNDIYNKNTGNVGIGGAPGAYKLDISGTGSSGMVRLFNATSTHVDVKMGSAQTGQVFTFIDNSGNVMSYILSDGTFGTTDTPGNRKTVVSPTEFGMAQDIGMKWQNNVSWGAGTKDLGILRSAANKACINRGGTDCTSLGDLDLRNLTGSGTTDFGAATSLKIPTGAGATAATNGFLAYDTTTNMLHGAQSSADAKIPQFTVTPANGDCPTWVVSGSNYKLGTSGAPCGGGSGSVTSVGFTGGLISVANPTTTPAFTVAGTSGGIPYFSAASTWASSGALTQHALTIGGGAGAAPTPLASLGTSTTVLHGASAGDPTFGAVVSNDLNITTTTCTNQFLTAISSGGVGTCTSGVISLISTSGPVTDPGGPAAYQFNNAAGALTFNAPAGVASPILQRCYRNATGKSGAITIQMATSNTVDLAGVNSSSAGTLVSTGALGDAVCIVSDAANHWYAYIQKGSWSTT